MGGKDIKDKLEQEKKVLEGNATKDKVYSSVKGFEDIKQAKEAFARTKEKLFNIDSWSEINVLTADFELYDSSGKKKASSNPEKWDYIKIVFPGPLPKNWVIITDLKEDEDLAYITVNPSKKPNSSKEKTEHFFIKEAQSTFRVERNGNDVSAFEIGTNEGINNQGEESGNRSLINTLIAEGGWAGFQKFQWEKLTDYLVHKTEINS